MNRTPSSLGLRLAVPAIALIALALTGEPATPQQVDTSALAQAQVGTLERASDHEAAHERRRTAIHLRWSLTLPTTPRLLGSPQPSGTR